MINTKVMGRENAANINTFLCGTTDLKKKVLITGWL
jgi:hypothetical protein